MIYAISLFETQLYFFNVAEKGIAKEECGRSRGTLFPAPIFAPWYLPSVPSTCLLLYNKVKRWTGYVLLPIIHS